jgi:hypothetical protein
MPRGITENDVFTACDALLLAGERPTIERVPQKIGRGSPNTVTLANPARVFAERRAYPVLRCCLVYELDRGPHSKANHHDSAVRSLQTRCQVNLAASLLFLGSNEQRGLHLRHDGCRVMR